MKLEQVAGCRAKRYIKLSHNFKYFEWINSLSSRKLFHAGIIAAVAFGDQEVEMKFTNNEGIFAKEQTSL